MKKRKVGEFLKSILIISKENNYFPETIAHVRDGTNDIVIRVINPSSKAALEIYCGAEYATEVTVGLSGEAKIPDKYCQEGKNLHIRYVDDKVVSQFFHIIGNQSLYEELKIEQKAINICFCEGEQKQQQKNDKEGIEIEVVAHLPKKTEAKSGVVYFVPKKGDDTQDKYDEYMFVDGEWERFTEKEETVDIDFDKILI